MERALALSEVKQEADFFYLNFVHIFHPEIINGKRSGYKK